MIHIHLFLFLQKKKKKVNIFPLMHFALGGVHKNSIQRNVIIDFVWVTGSTPTQSYPNHIPHVKARRVIMSLDVPLPHISHPQALKARHNITFNSKTCQSTAETGN